MKGSTPRVIGHAQIHIGVLDGWRAISITLVLLGHLLPLGPKSFRINEAVAACGMVIFFILSGFLITSFLLKSPKIRPFLIRRFFRIVPLAWLYSFIVCVAADASPPIWAALFFFYANLPPFWLSIEGTGHLWSLCLEMQFYVGIAMIVALFGQRGLWLLPLLCAIATGYRIITGTQISIVSWLRVDEILAGATLALAYAYWPNARLMVSSTPIVMTLGLLLLMASCHPASDSLAYVRPYIAAVVVGLTLYTPKTAFSRLLELRSLAYIASISFALYVIHGGLASTWLGTGDTAEKYVKRPLLFIVLLCLAHASTHLFECRWIRLGQSWSRQMNGNSPAHGA